jgi:hypothetical protein
VADLTDQSTAPLDEKLRRFLRELADTTSRPPYVYFHYDGFPRPNLASDALTFLRHIEAGRLTVAAGMPPCPEGAKAPEPVYWQWRRLPGDWTLDYTFSYEVKATTPDSEVRALYAAPLPVAGQTQPDGGKETDPTGCRWQPCTHPDCRCTRPHGVPVPAGQTVPQLTDEDRTKAPQETRKQDGGV